MIDWAGEMAQLEKELAATSSNLSSISKTHMVEGEIWLLQVVLWLHTCDMTYKLKHTQIMYKHKNKCRNI